MAHGMFTAQMEATIAAREYISRILMESISIIISMMRDIRLILLRLDGLMLVAGITSKMARK